MHLATEPARDALRGEGLAVDAPDVPAAAGDAQVIAVAVEVGDRIEALGTHGAGHSKGKNMKGTRARPPGRILGGIHREGAAMLCRKWSAEPR